MAPLAGARPLRPTTLNARWTPQPLTARCSAPSCHNGWPTRAGTRRRHRVAVIAWIAVLRRPLPAAPQSQDGPTTQGRILAVGRRLQVRPIGAAREPGCGLPLAPAQRAAADSSPERSGPGWESTSEVVHADGSIRCRLRSAAFHRERRRRPKRARPPAPLARPSDHVRRHKEPEPTWTSSPASCTTKSQPAQVRTAGRSGARRPPDRPALRRSDARLPIGQSMRFRVKLDGGADLGDCRVRRLSVEYEILEYKEGGENAYVHRIPGRAKYQNIKLTRPLNKDSKRRHRLDRQSQARGQAPDRRDSALIPRGNRSQPGTWRVFYR